MNWKTWTKVIAILALLIAAAQLWYAGFHQVGPQIEVRNFPTYFDLDSLEVDKNIVFTFFIHNSGDQAAFIDSIQVIREHSDASPVTDSITIEPSTDISLAPQESQEIRIELPAPNEELVYSLYVQVYSENEIIESETVPVLWGGFLQ